MKKSILFLFVLLLFFNLVEAQNVGINNSGAAPVASAMLDIVATDKGLLVPRVALTAINAAGPITAPATSLLVYNTATAGVSPNNVIPGYYYWNGTIWVRFAAGNGTAWTLLGNAGTVAGTNFIGTTDAVDWVVKTSNAERMRVLSTGNVGIGTPSPVYRLDLNQGTFGFGNSNVRTENRDDAGLQGNAGAQSGFFETSNPSNYPAGASSWWHLIDTRHSNNGNNYALQLAGSFFDQRLYFRKTNNNAAQAWTEILTSSSAWTLLGNAGTVAGTNFIGTTDAIDWVVKTNNTERMRVLSAGNVGIGIVAPVHRLDVVGLGGSNIDIRSSGRLWSNTASGGMWLSDLQDCFIGNISATQFGFWSSSVGWNALNITKTTGYVGIGVATPSTKLHVIADADNLPVVYGINTNITAATTSYGVRGECSSTGLGSAGVSGVSTNSSQNEIGVVGDYSLWGAGVFGLGWAASYANMPVSRDHGVFGTCNFSTGTGVYGFDGSNSAGSYALYGSGKFAVTGAKAASVPTTKGNQLLYCQESPEMWFEDIGSSKLVNGKVEIKLDKLYLETVFIDETHPMQVFLQENGESNGLIVIKEKDKFLVKEKNGGKSNIEFSYRILAKRRFYQDHRFGVDSNQPFEDNLKNAKNIEPTTTDPMVMKAFVEAAKQQKEAEYAKMKEAEKTKNK